MDSPVSTKRFRIAFSFAGEKRAFVKQTADLLARQFGPEKILYDKYHEAEFARNDLGIYLPNLYNHESDLVVVVVCPNYDVKEWTGLEWLAIHHLLQQRLRDKVQLCRFKRAHVDGLFGGAGFIELDDKTPEAFVTLILERLALNEGHPKDYYTKPAVVVASVPNTDIPHNLPRLQPFFGRENELKTIADALDPASRTWGALIDGPGGMGKTSLAVRAAYDAPPDIFRKIVFISLKSRELDDDGLRDPSVFLLSGLVELFGELARELDRDDILKVAEDQRPRLLLDALRGTQTLLVLDNLESLLKPERDTLFTFIKKLPAGCKAILTSRGRIGSGAEELILEKLDEQAALDTLAELATHNPHLAKTSEADRLVLYRETGGKPLLLRWTAGQIGRGHCLSFTDALDFLRSCPPDNDPLEFIFGDLVEDFSDAETRALCALTYFTLPAKVEHVAANAGLPEAETDRALRGLVNRSLAVPNDELTAFTLVPMVADFLRRKKSEVVADTGDRLEQRAYALIIENGYQNHDHFPLLEAAWPGIAPALALFLEGDNMRLQTVCAALADFLEFHGHWDEWLALSEKAEVQAVAAADHDKAGWRAYHTGYIHSLRRQADAVLACADRAATHWATAKASARELARAVGLRGVGHLFKGDYPAAIAAYQGALDLDRSLDAESVGIAISLSDLAGAERLFGDYDAAEAHYSEALRVACAADWAEGMAGMTGDLAALALARKDWSAAETLAREALSLSEAVHRQELIAGNNYRLAIALVRQSKAAEALPHAKRAVEIFAHLGSLDLADAQATLARCGG
ncbi:MAG: tetratricopeptide repeat protein [Xanthomonadales bacterium]|nr:tetratricopeptide repeat protein [Xanthomonadales bacterium]